MVSEFIPPQNDFYKQAARLSVWSKSDMEGFIVDGNSESDESADVSIRRLSDNSSFAGKSQRSSRNSIASMSKGSFSSQGSKGIRNFLGNKFMKRANSIKKQETKGLSSNTLHVPGQPKQFSGIKAAAGGESTIIEDMDSDID